MNYKFIKLVELWISELYIFVGSKEALRIYACCIPAISRFYCTAEGIFQSCLYI